LEEVLFFLTFEGLMGGGRMSADPTDGEACCMTF
jgi:hypothetical protein